MTLGRALGVAILLLTTAACGGTHHDIDLTVSADLLGHRTASVHVRCPTTTSVAPVVRRACARIVDDRERRALVPVYSVHLANGGGPQWWIALKGSFYGSEVDTQLVGADAMDFWLGVVGWADCLQLDRLKQLKLRRTVPCDSH
jgi:hypothetical protein